MGTQGVVSGAGRRAGVGAAGAGVRDRFKQNLGQKTEQSYKTKDENASTFRDFFDKDKLEGVKLYRVPKGDVTVVLDIIPYFAGPRDPRNKEGDPVYTLDVQVHKNIGPMNDQIVCLAQYGKPCPVCEEVSKRNAASEDYNLRIKPLKPSRRCLYNVIIRDNGGEQEKKGMQVWEIAHFFMEKKLAGITKNPRTGGIIVFSDPDEGKSVSFSKRNPSKETVEYSSHQFLDRPGVITDDELNGAHVLDNLIKILDYQTIHEMLYAVPAEEASEEETTQETQVAQTQQEPPPQRQTRQRPAVEETKDEVAQTQTQTNVGTPVCPHGGTIGESIDELDGCMQCDVYDACNAIAESK